MKVLVIDNQTIHLPSIQEATKDHDLTIIPRERFRNDHAEAAEAIILTGGSGKARSGEHSHLRRLIKETRTPLLGICWGFQLIATTFGCPFHKLPKERRGMMELRRQAFEPVLNGM